MCQAWTKARVQPLPSAESDEGKKARTVFANILGTYGDELFTRGTAGAAWKSATEDLVLNEDCDFKKLKGKDASVKRMYQKLCEIRSSEIAAVGSGTGCGDENPTEFELTLDGLMSTEKRCKELAESSKADKSLPAQVLQVAMQRSVSYANARKAERAAASGSDSASKKYRRMDDAIGAEMYNLDDPRHPDYESDDAIDGEDEEVRDAAAGALAAAEADKLQSPSNERQKKHVSPASAPKGKNKGGRRGHEWGRQGGKASTMYGPKAAPHDKNGLLGGEGLSGLQARLEESQAKIREAAEAAQKEALERKAREEQRDREQGDMMKMMLAQQNENRIIMQTLTALMQNNNPNKV